MAHFQITMQSQSLMRNVTFHLLWPNDINDELKGWYGEHYRRPMKLLMLLGGFSTNLSDWLESSLITQYSLKYNLAVIIPSGENSFYLNGQGEDLRYEDFVGRELLEYVGRSCGIHTGREDTLIGGLSMGGFGAIHTGLAYPETYSRIIGFSSALIVNSVIRRKGADDSALPGLGSGYVRRVFGNAEDLPESPKNPEFLVRRLKALGKEIPGIYLAVGTEDPFIEENREFRDFLKKEDVPLSFHEGPGSHTWDFWNEYLEAAIRWGVT